ncbi:hypothetical protein OGAPHI_004935 [Ogataea philodendri]|uniref:Peroxin 20 n=1 Tax=Ogataea philodendri TaxID=1378263 RepID=A0A9P8P1U0_9ASCO|nr:uncharacterized protein OGAPHI_004935 [Ogataea philodendri]KAH3663534.1 hypothetical protein OGAPHI_004935 [Ogataea philodendri]
MNFGDTFGDSCGGNNALNKLARRANIDTSVTNQLRTGSDASQFLKPTYRSVDQRLETGYREFQQQGSSSFQPELPGFLPEQGQWIDRFREMNLDGNAQSLHFEQPSANSSLTPSAWRNEFLQNNQHVQQQQQYTPGGHTASYRPQTQFSAPMVQMPRQASAPPPQQDYSAVDAAFEEIEDQLAQQPVNTLPQESALQPTNEEDKIKFAQLAKSVFMTMSKPPSDVSQETNAKFQNSNFLKLMSRISTREVEISEQKDKFIDSQGRDIRDMLPDPLKDIKQEGLASLGPFDSAQQVYSQMGEELRPSMWQ